MALKEFTKEFLQKLNSMTEQFRTAPFMQIQQERLIEQMTNRQLRDTFRSCQRGQKVMESRKSMLIGSETMSNSQEKILKILISIRYLRMRQRWQWRRSRLATARTELLFTIFSTTKWLSITSLREHPTEKHKWNSLPKKWLVGMGKWWSTNCCSIQNMACQKTKSKISIQNTDVPLKTPFSIGIEQDLSSEKRLLNS